MNQILYFIGSYFIGNFLTAYIFLKVLGKGNVKNQGSGNPGARNIGRLFGKRAFVITFLGDAFKGSLVIIIGRYLDLTEIEILAGLTLAVFGHIKPVIFRFKGGKGISTFIGGIITLEPMLALVIVIGFLLLYPFNRSFTISGLGTFCLLPFSISYLYHSIELLLIMVILIVIIILAHSENLFRKRET